VLPRKSRPFPAAVSVALPLGLSLGVLLALGLTCAPVTAATRTRSTSKSTTKSTTKSSVKSPGTQTLGGAPAAKSAAPTTQPAPRRAGVPLKGWDNITRSEWPTPGAAIVVRPLDSSVKVYPTPDAMVASLRFDGGKTVYGKVTLLVVGAQPGWWKVLMPVRPNGTVGWVRAEDVERADLHSRIVIELDTNTLTYTRDGKVVVKDRVAAGTGGTPTPTGLFFVKEIVPQANPRGALGPIALGLSGYSEVLYSFAGGSGVIGIHGTNNPSLIGSDVSHGCIRMRNESISTIAAAMQLGTPVEIVKTIGDLPTNRWQLPAADAMALATPAPVAPSAAGSTGPVTTVSEPTSTLP